MSQVCQEIEEKIEETITKPIEEFEERQEQRCREQRCKWYLACLNKLVCWLVVVVVKVVRYVTTVVVKTVVRLVCEVINIVVQAAIFVWNNVIKPIGRFIWEKIIRPVANWIAEAFGMCTRRRRIEDLTRLQPNHNDSNAINFKNGKRTILCLDGGGVRGIVTLHALKALEEKYNSRCLDMFDMFSGTSTGAIIAGALAWGVSVDDLIQLYRDKHKLIFTKSKRRILGGIGGGIVGAAAGAGAGSLLGPVGAAIGGVGGAVGGAIAGTKMILPWYDNKAIICILNSIFEDDTLAHCYKDIMITSKDTVMNETTFFTAFHPEPWSDKESNQNSWLQSVRGTYKDVSIASAIAASAASAPLYFKSIGRFIDGGVGSFNNSSYAASVEALRYSGEYEVEYMMDDRGNETVSGNWPKTKPMDGTQLYEEGQVKVLSFGTGAAPTLMEEGEAKSIKTPIGWLSWIIPALMDDADEQQTYIANNELNELEENQGSIDYQRFQLYWTEKTHEDLEGIIAFVNSSLPPDQHLDFDDFGDNLHEVKFDLDAVKRFELLDKVGQAFGKWLILPLNSPVIEKSGLNNLGRPVDSDQPNFHINAYSEKVKTELSEEV